MDLAAAAMREKRYADAVTSFREAAAIDKRRVEPWVEMGAVFCALKQLDECEAAYSEAIRASPPEIRFAAEVHFYTQLAWAAFDKDLAKASWYVGKIVKHKDEGQQTLLLQANLW